jgi:hypothetical protein
VILATRFLRDLRRERDFGSKASQITARDVTDLRKQTSE